MRLSLIRKSSTLRGIARKPGPACRRSGQVPAPGPVGLGVVGGSGPRLSSLRSADSTKRVRSEVLIPNPASRNRPGGSVPELDLPEGLSEGKRPARSRPCANRGISALRASEGSSVEGASPACGDGCRAWPTGALRRRASGPAAGKRFQLGSSTQPVRPCSPVMATASPQPAGPEAGLPLQVTGLMV